MKNKLIFFIFTILLVGCVAVPENPTLSKTDKKHEHLQDLEDGYIQLTSSKLSLRETTNTDSFGDFTFEATKNKNHKAFSLMVFIDDIRDIHELIITDGTEQITLKNQSETFEEETDGLPSRSFNNLRIHDGDLDKLKNILNSRKANFIVKTSLGVGNFSFITVTYDQIEEQLKFIDYYKNDF